MKSAQLTTVFASPVATFFAGILLSGALVGANAVEPSDEQESQREKLAKETQNPVTNLTVRSGPNPGTMVKHTAVTVTGLVTILNEAPFWLSFYAA
jgi:hypothetical protein